MHQNPRKLPQPAWLFVLLAASISMGSSALAQQTVPFMGDRPVAPRGLPIPPLPEDPVIYETAEGQDIKVSVFASGLEWPHSLAFLPDDAILVTERVGNLRIIRDGALDPEPVPGGPPSYFYGQSGVLGAIHGYMDIALHPDFEDNGFIYLTYTKPLADDENRLALARGVWTGNSLADVEDIFIPDGGVRARIVFAPDGTLFMSTNGAGAQDLNTHAGKILRINDDGTVPPDNPFVGMSSLKPEIYAYGTRTSLGLAIHPGTGHLWQAENGENGGDELNVIRPGINYGWPIVSYGRTYSGPWRAEYPNHEGFEPPIVFWMPSIAVSGLTFYTGDALPRWKGDVFVGGLRYGEIPGTGRVERILFDENMDELRRESLLVDWRRRIRDIRQGPDGFLYLTTDEAQGAVVRIEPAGR